MSNMPKLRFKEFNDEWELKKLELLCSKISDGIHSTPVYDENGEYYFINGNNLKKGVIILDEKTKRVSKEEYQKHFRELNNTTILMSINGTIGNIAFYNNEKAMLGKSACYININDNKTNKYFISNQVSSTKIQYYYISELTGSTIKNLSLKTIKNTPINLPSKQEQEKIASFLTSVDTKIEQLTKKEKLLQQYKKGVMQKIFNQEIRFQADDGSEFCDWEEKRLKEVLDYEQPTKYIVESTEYNGNYNTPVLTAGKTFILGYTNEENGIYTNSPVIIFDDFTTANHYVDFDFKVKSSAMKLLKEKNENICLKFVYEFIQKLHFPIGEHKRYWISEYSYLKIKLPCLEEQIKIANFLSSIDTKIEQTQKQLEQTKEFKKALLQQMFV